MSLLFLRPIASNKLTQGFGENQVCAKCQPGGFPIRPYILVDKVANICPPGTKDFYKLQGYKGHNGGDWAAWHNEPGYFNGMYKGWMKTSHDQDGGLIIDIVSNEPLHPCSEVGCPPGTIHYVMTRYAHGSKAIGFDKKPIQPGDHIMLCDNTGDSSGDHLHWAPKWCDQNGVGLHKDNGYGGAFDYNPYFQNIFILDYIKAQLTNLPPAAQHPDLPSVAPVQASLDFWQQVNKIAFQISLCSRTYPHASNCTPKSTL